MTETQKVTALPYVADIDPYDPGQPLEALAERLGLKPEDIVMLCANENCIGTPESAVKAADAEMRRAFRYPDGNAWQLKAALAEGLGVPQDWIIHGNGSDELLGLLSLAFLDTGRRCVFPQYSFSVYELSAHMNGARTEVVPVRADFTVDADALAEACGPDTGIVYLTNPNNPTGLALTAEEVERFIEKVPATTVVVLDEAYREFQDEDLQVDSMALVCRFPNLIVTRTFSKAYGLAGLRMGYGVAQPALIDLLNRIRPPYNANRPAQAAAAAAYADKAFLAQTCAVNRDAINGMTALFDEFGLTYLPTQTNFIMVKVPRAAEVAASLLQEGIIVRGLRSYGLPDWLRISTGRPAEMERFAKAFRRAAALLARK